MISLVSPANNNYKLALSSAQQASSAGGVDSFFSNPSSWLKLLATQSPFANEAVLVATHSFFPNMPKRALPFSEVICLGGIGLNAALASQDGPFAVLMKVLGLSIFSFLAPRPFIPFMQNLAAKLVGGKGGQLEHNAPFPEKAARLGGGLAAIALLEFAVHVWDHNFAPWLKNRLDAWLGFQANTDPINGLTYAGANN